MVLATKDQILGNTLLSVLLDDDLNSFYPHLLAFDLLADAVIIRAGENVDETWFPCGSALAAFCLTGSDGNSVDVGYVGREGALGGIVSNGSIPAYCTAIVRVPGQFLRIKTSALEQLKLDSVAVRHWLSRYSDCLLAQVFQTSACNATHTIRQRVAKLILSTAARTNEKRFEMTQEELANMLGVGRTFVNRVLGTLRREGRISLGRSKISIEDLAALKSISCNCSASIEDHFDTVMHGVYPPPL